MPWRDRSGTGNLGCVNGDLEHLVDDEDFAALLARVTLDDIAVAWCRYTTEPLTGDSSDHALDDPDWWAISFFMAEALVKNRELHRAALLKLLDHAESDRVIGRIGAGPLEDFISDDDDDLRWIEAEASTNEKLRQALGGVWVTVTEETLERLDRAAGTRLKRQPPREAWPPEVRRLEDTRARLEALLDSQPWALIGDDPTPEEIATAEERLRAVREVIDALEPFKTVPQDTNPEEAG